MDEKPQRRGFLAGIAASPLVFGPAAAIAVQEGPQRSSTDKSDGPSTGRTVVAGSPSPAYSKAVIFGGVAYVAGVVGQKPGSRELVSAEFEAQCHQTLENLREAVEASGSTLDQVLKCTCFLTRAEDFQAFNKTYLSFFAKNPPARSTVVVKELVIPGALLEVDCFAAVGK